MRAWTVLRTTFEDALAAFEANTRTRARLHVARRAYEREMGRRMRCVEHYGGSVAIGMEASDDGDRHSPPCGWFYDDALRALVPQPNAPDGRSASRRLSMLSVTWRPIAGLPELARDRPSLERHGTHLVAAIPSSRPLSAADLEAAGVDLSVWERVTAPWPWPVAPNRARAGGQAPRTR